VIEGGAPGDSAELGNVRRKDSRIDGHLVAFPEGKERCEPAAGNRPREVINGSEWS